MHTIPYQTIPNFYKLNIDEESILRRGWTMNDITKYLVQADVKLLMMSKNDPLKILRVFDLEKIEKIETIFDFLPKKNNCIVKSNIQKMEDPTIYLEDNQENTSELYKKYYTKSYIIKYLHIPGEVLNKYFPPDKVCVNPHDKNKAPMKLYLKFKIDDYVKDRSKQKGSINSIKPNKYNPTHSKYLTKYLTKNKALKRLKKLKLSKEKFDNLFKPDKKYTNEKGLIINLYDKTKISKYLGRYYNNLKKHEKKH